MLNTSSNNTHSTSTGDRARPIDKLEGGRFGVKSIRVAISRHAKDVQELFAGEIEIN